MQEVLAMITSFLYSTGSTTDTKTVRTLLDRANSLLQKKMFFNRVTTISYAVSPAMNESHTHKNLLQQKWPTVTITTAAFSPRINRSLHALLIKICTSRGDHSHFWCCWNAPPRCVHIQCLISVNIQQASMNVSGFHVFYTGGFNDTLLLQSSSSNLN